jgi:hypothetical protein
LDVDVAKLFGDSLEENTENVIRGQIQRAVDIQY